MGILLSGTASDLCRAVPYAPCWELVPSLAAGFSLPGARNSNLQTDAGESFVLEHPFPCVAPWADTTVTNSCCLEMTCNSSSLKDSDSYNAAGEPGNPHC